MIDWRARYDDPNPEWGPDLQDEIDTLLRAERTLAATPDYTVDKARRQLEIRRALHRAGLAAARTSGDWMAVKLDAAGFDRRAEDRGLTRAELEGMLPRRLLWRNAPALAQRLLARVR